MNRKFLWMGISLLALVIAAALALSMIGKPNFHGVVIDPPYAAPDFTLIDQRGEEFRLSDQRGSIVLLFFGYTHCPDICPLTMANFKQAAQTLSAEADSIRFALITTDIAQDTPDVLGAYVNMFNPNFIGLTGSQDALTQAYKDYGVTVLDEGVTHSGRVYLVDQDGLLRATYPSDTPPADLVSDLRILLP